jgi:hypothetical protein
MIRLLIHAHCDHPYCKRFTEATMSESAFTMTAARSRGIEFPSSPTDESTGWVETEYGATLCPEHALKKKP